VGGRGVVEKGDFSFLKKSLEEKFGYCKNHLTRLLYFDIILSYCVIQISIIDFDGNYCNFNF